MKRLADEVGRDGSLERDAAKVGGHDLTVAVEEERGRQGVYAKQPCGRTIEGAAIVNLRPLEALALDLVALRRIEPGEEITFDYGMTLWFTPE